MPRIDANLKIEYIEKYIRGEISQKGIASALGTAPASVQQWIRNYHSMGPSVFTMVKNKKYSAELKRSAVEDYLTGQGSQEAICAKYGIRSKGKLQVWIKKYNSHGEQKTSGKEGKTIMTKGRSTTFEERVDIVKYCIAHDHNYNQTAEKYQISYQQARSYTIKYETFGVEGLQDKRGKRKQESELTEIERLRAENKLLRAEKEKAEMETSFLKKLNEIERRRD